MERLSKQLKTVEKLVKDGIAIGDSMELTEDCVKILQYAAHRLAHYEDLEEQGRLVVLPESTDKATIEALRSGKMSAEQLFHLSAVTEAALAASGKEG